MSARGLRLALAAGAALALAGAPARAAAQFSPRLQGVWVNDHVAGFVIGAEIREPIGGEAPPPAEGPRVIGTRDWAFTGMAGVGLNFAPPSDHPSHALFQAHGGVMYRLGGDLEPRLGLVAALYLPARVAGPAARLELMDVGVVQAGWMFDAGLHVALEVAARFLMDVAGL